MPHLDKPCYREFRKEVRTLADELERCWERQEESKAISPGCILDIAEATLTKIRKKLLEKEVVERCDLGERIRVSRGKWDALDVLLMALPGAARLAIFVQTEIPACAAYYDRSISRKDFRRRWEDPKFYDEEVSIRAESDLRGWIVGFLRWYVACCPRQWWQAPE